MPVAGDELLERVAAHLVAAGVPVSRLGLYNTYRLLLAHEDPAVLDDRQRQEYVRPDPELRDSLLVWESHDFPYVSSDPDDLARLAERVQAAAAELRPSPERREAIAAAAGDELLGAERAAEDLDLHEGGAYVRKHVWPRVQLYRRANRSNPGWTYLMRRSELERVVRELKIGETDDGAEQEARRVWASLNPRQQDYLVATYRLQRPRPRAWIRYGLTDGGFRSELSSAIRRDRARDSGTGSTWNALETRALVQCRYALPAGLEEPQLEVRLTRAGHLTARLGLHEAERQQRERQHELLNALDVIVKRREGWGANLQSLRRALERSGPTDLTAEASRLLSARIAPDLDRVEDDLRAIRRDLARLNEARRSEAGPRPRRRRTSGSPPLS